MSDKLPSPSQILGGKKLPSPGEVLGSSLKKKGESQSQLEEASTSLDISDNQGDQPLGSSGDGDVYTYNGESYKKKGKNWYKESGGKYVPITAGNVAKREEILNTKAKKVVDRWANVTETKSEGKPIYKTDDYIDVVQSKDYIGASKPAYDQAYQMMKEDFGVKEFEAYNKIDNIDLDLIANTEEYTVAELNKRFKGSGLYFEETGLGNQMRVVSTPDGGLTTTNEGVFNLYPKNYTGQSGIPTFDVASAEAEQKRLKEFLNNSLLKKSEKEYIQSDNIKNYGDLVKLQVENPRKYGENFLDEQSTTNWIDNQYLDLAIETKSLKREQDALNKEIQQYKGREIPIDVKKKFESRINILTDKKESLINTHGELTNIQTGLKEATGYYYDANEKKGNIAGVIGRNFVKGLMNLPKMEMDIVADAVPFIFGENATSSVQRTKMEAAGMSDTEINNTLTRDLKESVNKKAVKSLQDIASFGTTEEYAQSEDRNDLEKVAGFLAESVGTGLSAGGNTTLSKLAFFAQSYNAMEDQMNSKEFDDLNLAEKKLMSVPYGIAIGFLERLGFKATTGGSKLLSGVVTKSIARALTQVPKDASLALMKSAINKSVIATMAESGLSIVAGSFVEGSVEATQNTTEIGAKQLFNYLEGQEYFKDVPDLTTKEGMSKAVSMASEDFYYGMLGGIVMASGSEAVTAVKNGYSNKKQDESFDLFYNSITNDNLRNTVKTEIKSNLVTGKINKEEADAQMESVGKAYSVFKSIPENLPTKDKRESFNLIVEKQTLEKEIEGKDPSLVDAQKKRVSEINESLKTISNNATKKTIEQQQASQAEGGISEYQGAGEGQQKDGNAEGGQREAKVNEADSGDSTIPSKVQKEVATYRADEQAELLKAIPKIESYKVDGELDKTLMQKTVLSKYNKIYNKYDKLISPLLETTTENKKTVETEPKIIETKDTKTYSEALSETKSLLKEEGNGLDLQVSDVSKEEADAIIAEGGNIFMTEDGLAGAYVKKDGYMGGLFKSPKATYSKVAKLLQQARVKVGGRFMEAYATELEKIYVNNGFRPVARLKFNEEYAPEGWNAPKSALASKPDVVFFAYDPDGKYKIGDGEYLEDYDTAYEIAKNFKPKTVSNKVNYKQNLVTAENSTQVASRQDTPIKQNTAKSVKLITKALPGVKVYLHNNESEMHQALADATGMSVDEVSKEVGKSSGSQVKGEIHINMQTAKANTLMHEAFHEAILRSGKSVKTITDFANGLKNIISNKDIKARLDEFVSMYEESDQSEEFLSELGSIMAEAETELTTTKLQQFLNLINRIAKSLGLPVILKSTATKQEAVDFINTIAKSLRTGEEIEEILKPASQILGTPVIKQSKQALIKDFDTTQPKVDGVEMIYPEKSSMDKILEDSGGAAVFINSDGTKVGKVFINGREIIVNGGIDYTYIKKNVDDSIGFAASEDGKISVLKTISEQIIKERDQKNPSSIGKPIAVFVVSQNGETMLGEWYAAEYIMEGIDQSLIKRNYKGGVTQAKKDFISAIESAKIGKTKSGIADIKAKDKVIKMIKEGKFDTHNGRIQIAKDMASKAFSFGFRVNLNKELIASSEKSWNSGKNRNIKKALADSGYTMNDFWNKFLDERFLKDLNSQRLQADKGSSISNKTFSGFFYNPSDSLQDQVNHAKLGIKHEQFNSSFKSAGNFLLDSAYDVNKLFPNMGYPTQEGINEYNSSNNTDFNKKQMSIVDKIKVSTWLNENNKSKLVINPYGSIAMSMYTGYIDKTNQPSKIKTTEETPSKIKSQKPLKEEIIAYHRSSKKFNKFNISNISADNNKQRYGYGLYFSDNIPIEEYGDYLYKVKLFKDKKEYDLIDTKKAVEEKIVNKVVKALNDNNKKSNEVVEFSYNGWLFYKSLSRILGGDKQASNFLSNNGIDGLKNNISNNWNDYILFNDNVINIENNELGEPTYTKKIKQQKNNLPENVLERLTETKDGKIVFHHYSKEKRDVIKPMVNQASFNSSKEEIRAINSVGGVSFWYTMANQKEALGADELHTVLVPKEKVYYLQKDVDGFYDEAKRQFNEVRPGQAFDDNYQAAWIGKVAQDNGYDILVSEWRNGELRAQSTKDIKPEKGNTEFKERVKDTYKVGEKAMIYGRESTITKVDGNILTYEGSGTSGTFDVESPFNARSIKKIRLQKTAPNGKPSKLDDVQWEQVRTPAFKRWFGDWENDPKNASKIVDSNGEPMPVYHGTTEDFEIFMGGSYFTDDYMNADGYASGEIVLETFLNIKNPLIIDSKGRKWDDLQSKYGSSTREIVGNLDEKIYDGVAFNNINDNWFDDEEGEPQNVYYTLEPNQVKLADGTNTTFDATKSSIKLQKTPQETRMDNESENVFKKSLDRGTNWATATQNALDYIQKSKWYQDATDIEREQKIRDFKLSKKQKIKKAPSVAKVLGAPKPNMVTVNEVAAFKDQLRLEAKAAREAKADLNSKRKSLGNAIKGMVKLGKLKATQAVTIIKRVSQVNLDNPVMVERLIDYASRVFERADYQERLDRAFSYRRAIRRLLKSDNQAQVIGMANQFTKIDPSMVENIDEYIAMAEIVKNAVAPSRVKGLDVVLRESANIETVSNFVKDILEKQEAKLKEELLATNNDLLESGVISDNMTVKEIQQIIDSIKDPEYKMDSQEKERYIRSYLSKRFESLASIVDNILETGENPFTGEKMAVSEKDGTIISNLLKVDLSEMSIRDAVFVVEAMDNFINNGITSKLEGVLSTYEGELGLKKEIKSGKVARALKLYFSPKIGRYSSVEFTPLPLMIERMFSGVTSGISVMKSMGLDIIINGVNKANNIHNKIINEYYDKFIKNSKTFHNPENVYERGMLSFLKRNVTGSLEEMKSETNRRINLIIQSIDVLSNYGDESQKAMAKIYQKIFDKLDVSTGDIDIINARASKENRDAVDWWMKEWSKHYKDLYDVSLSIYNYDLGSDVNYSSPDQFKTLKEESIDKNLLERNSSFLISMDNVTDKSKTGVLMESTRPTTMEKGRYVSLDFDSNNSNSLKGALVDINTAAGIRQVDGFLNSNLLNKLIPTAKDRDALKIRVNRYIRRAKGKITVPTDLYKDVDAVLNFAASLGVGKALGGVLQSVKQTIPIALSTAINTGKFNVAGVEFNQWLNKTGMPISNRGIESLSTIDSIDRRMEAKDTKIKDSLKWIAEKQQLYVKFFLSRPDVFIARSGFESYYLQYLGKKSIDWANHEPNQDALNYAQSMVDRQQNISDPMLGGEFLTSEESVKRIAKKVLFPFASFALNQKARLNSDLINLVSKTTSKQDKKIAAKSAIATVAEMVAYRAMSAAIGYSFYKAAEMVINGFIGDDDDEDKDQDKKWWISASKFPIKSMITDLVSPVQMADQYVTMGTDFLLSLVTGDTKAELDESVKQENEIRALKDQDPMTTNQEEDFRQKVKDKSTFQVGSQYDLVNGFGMVSIASDLYKKIYDDYTLAMTGEFEDEYKGNITTKKIRPVEQDLMKNTLMFSALYAAGILPKESDQIVTKVVNMVKKNAMSESEYEKYSEFKTEFKREPNPFEMGMIKSEKKYQYISDDVNWVDTKGGLTLSQGREYVKIINTLGEVDNSTLLEIKAGKTADQIVKSMRAKL